MIPLSLQQPPKLHAQLGNDSAFDFIFLFFRLRILHSNPATGSRSRVTLIPSATTLAILCLLATHELVRSGHSSASLTLESSICDSRISWESTGSGSCAHIGSFRKSSPKVNAQLPELPLLHELLDSSPLLHLLLS